MSFAVCITATAPLRKEANHRTEMTSQLLLGEFVTILKIEKEFLQVQCLHDDYTGWCQRSQLIIADTVIATESYTINAIDTFIINNQLCLVSMATPVYQNGLQVKGFEISYNAIGVTNAAQQLFTEENIRSVTLPYLNTPYLWGGRSIFGIDCSGFAQQVYKLLNRKLPRDAHQQAERGEALGFIQEAKCGDLAFFDNEQGFITHVGIMLNSEEIIHASGQVRIDKIDNQGIVNITTGLRTHQLRMVKRYG